MNPQEPSNQTPSTPPVPPQPAPPMPAPAPTPPPDSAPVPPPVPNSSSTPPVAPMTPAKPKKSHKRLFAIIGAILVLIGATLIAGWFLLWSPQAQSKRVANAFIHDMTAGNVEAALKIASDGTSADTKAFLTTAAEKTKGTAKLARTKFQDNSRYSLYTLSGANAKYARVIVAKENGKWVANSYVYGDTELKLIPSTASSSGSSSKSADSTASSTTPSPSSACLVSSDFNTINKFMHGDYGPPSADYSKQSDESADFTSYTYFLPDSLNFDGQDDIGDLTNTSRVNAFADFYKAHTGQSYTINLMGVVALTGAGDLSFATQRAQKVQSMLIADGVPASKIVAEAPQNIATYNGGVWKDSLNDPEAQRLARSVSMVIVPDKSCL